MYFITPNFNVVYLLLCFTEVMLNSKMVRPQTETDLTSKIGQCLQLGVRVYNSLSWPLLNLELCIQFFQDHQNGINNYQLDTRLATAGATQVQLPQVSEYFWKISVKYFVK